MGRIIGTDYLSTRIEYKDNDMQGTKGNEKEKREKT